MIERLSVCAYNNVVCEVWYTSDHAIYCYALGQVWCNGETDNGLGW